MRLAVWGATGHVGKALTAELAQRTDVAVDVYVRDIEKAKGFLDLEDIKNVGVFDIKNFKGDRYDGVINCIGIGNPDILAKYPERIFQITEEFDSFLINNAQKYPKCVFVNISSGAVYGTAFTYPVTVQTTASFTPNDISQNRYYGLAKLNSEVKHRAFSRCSIIDIRMFAFFSRFIDLSIPYFMSDVCNSILKKTVLKTSTSDFVRDYIHPFDLAQVIVKCVIEGGNAAYDLYSGAPVAKWEIIRYCSQIFGLRYESDTVPQSPTGMKSNYYSINHSAEKIGYNPQYTSLKGLGAEISKIVSKRTV